MMYQEIPENDYPKETKSMAFEKQPFVKVNTNDIVILDMQYSKMQMRCAVAECFMRKNVYKLLIKAQKKLPKGYRFKIYDAWRPVSLQQELYEYYYDKIIKTFNLYEKSADEKEEIVKKYVSMPKKSPCGYPVHTSGGAIDLTIVDIDGRELNMGTLFDDMSSKSSTTFYERTDEEEVKKNRRMLYWAMIESGFTNLPSEWWHYDYGDRFWSYYTKKPTIYGASYEKGELNIEEYEE